MQYARSTIHIKSGVKGAPEKDFHSISLCQKTKQSSPVPLVFNIVLASPGLGCRVNIYLFRNPAGMWQSYFLSYNTRAQIIADVFNSAPAAVLCMFISMLSPTTKDNLVSIWCTVITLPEWQDFCPPLSTLHKAELLLKNVWKTVDRVFIRIKLLEINQW